MKTFQQLGICPEIITLLKKRGIERPTPIQEKTIPSIFKKNDIIAKAQTGTGKTLAFLLPLLQRVHRDIRQEQVLIIAPTRELVRQLAEEAKFIAKAIDVDVLPLIGGRTIEGQLQQLGRRPQVVIGTPGRLLDHVMRQSLHLSTVRRIVLDEADQMLHMGFLPDVETLLEHVSSNRQLLLFSATIPDRIRNLAKTYMTKPISITVDGETITLDTIEQKVFIMDAKDKLERLIAMIKENNPYLAIVFCNTKEATIALSTELIKSNLNVGELHGDLTQGRRTQILRDFAQAKTQILVATDIAARGIDIEGISHIYNFDVPHDVDYYIHRIGRTGRAGTSGIAITFSTPEEEVWLRRIERAIQITLTKYTKDGQIKVKGKNSPPKKKKNTKGEKTSGTYKATKAKVHKATGHKGSNTRKRKKSTTSTRKKKDKRK